MVNKVIDYFEELYPQPVCALNFSNNYELLVAVVLSAQCTDKRVNIVTEKLFKLANNPYSMLQLGEEKIKEIIFPCGFYNNKTKSILKLSEDLVNRFNGQVPNNMNELISLKGVGRKTANVVIANAFNGQTIAVDTHVHRISKRLGFTSQKSSAYECELDLLKIIPYELRSKFHHQTIWFGRDICSAKKPKCEICKLKDKCKYFNEK